MRKKIGVIFIILSAMVFMGCPAIIVGAGAGAGVYSYMNGELKRTYPADYENMLKATKDALKSLKINTVSKEQLKDKTTLIKAVRSDKTPIRVKIYPVSLKLTKVSIRSGHVGLWDKKTSKLIHVTIANNVFQ